MSSAAPASKAKTWEYSEEAFSECRIPRAPYTVGKEKRLLLSLAEEGQENIIERFRGE